MSILPWAAGARLADAVAVTSAMTSPGVVDVGVTGLRSYRGAVRACLTRDAAFFPACEKDPAAIKLSVPARPGTTLRFTGVPAGDYAIAVLHDENGNGRLDVMLGIPREGVGFSRNPAFHFGPPSFKAARFAMHDNGYSTTVALKYFL